ncbi:hypothetical protein ABW20_dc0103294 [Dactylellina cionopaga]|nr:hypothetical protein ABW20_dc0103294 [Dactylellina cionopaga]
MLSQTLLSVLLVYGLVGLQASARPTVPPHPKPKDYKYLQPGQWHIPEGYEEMTFMSEEETHPPHMRKRADELSRLDTLPEVTLVFRNQPKSGRQKRAAPTINDLQIKVEDLESMTNEQFKEYLASITAKPFSEDQKEHPIISFDTFKSHINGEPDMSMISKYVMKLNFQSQTAVDYAKTKWALDPKDPKDYFYLVVDAQSVDDPSIKRATPFQIQKVTMDNLVATLEAYPMSWDVLGKLDISVYKDTASPKSKKRSLSKRVDLNPGFSIDVGFNKEKKEDIPLFKWPPFDLNLDPEAKIEQKYEITCHECHLSGSLELAARFRTTWWWVEEASISAAAKDIDAVVDIRASVELKKKKEWKKRLGHFPVTPFTVFGILNFGPRVDVSVAAWVEASAKVTVGTRLEAKLNTGIKFDLMNIAGFDPSTIQGPEVSFKPYVAEVTAEGTAGAAMVLGIGVSADILGSGIGSNMEVLIPKFEYKLKAGYDSELFCKDVNKNDQKACAADPKPGQVKPELESAKQIAISATPSLGFQVRFIGFEGEGLLEDLLPKMAEWEPEFLNQMFPLGSEVCGAMACWDQKFKTPPALKNGEPRPLTDRESQLYNVQKANRDINEKIGALKFAQPKLGKVVPVLSFKTQEVTVPKNVDVEVMKDVDVEFEYSLNGQAKKGTRKEKKLVRETQVQQVKQLQKFWVLTNPVKGQPVFQNKAELSGPMREFRYLQGCKMTTMDERTNKMVEFLACMSDDPLVRSKTWCPETPMLTQLKAMLQKQRFDPINWCQETSVYMQQSPISSKFEPGPCHDDPKACGEFYYV